MEDVMEVAKSELVVVVVSRPEDWPAAADLRDKREIPTIKGMRKFDVRAMSFAEETKVLNSNPDPEAPDVKRGRVVVKDTQDADFQAALSKTRLRRRVQIIDLCWMTLPGDTIDEKTAWAMENIYRGGDLHNLYSEIMNLTGYGTGKKADPDEGSVLVTKPEDWVKESKAPSMYSFTRCNTRIDFLMKGISGSRVQQIEAATEPGKPPMEMPLDPSGSRRGTPTPNPRNPQYMKKVEEMTDARNLMMLEAGLSFTIPGESIKQKMDWLYARPAGEVSELIAYQRFDVLSYRDTTDFGFGL